LNKKIFLLILALGLILRIGAALNFENIIWPDEIYQSLEQAHYLVFGYGIGPWEFREGLRSYLVPFFLAAIIFPFKILPDAGSFPYTVTVRLVLCLLSVTLIVFAYQYGKTFGSRWAGLIAAFMIAFWYEFIYFAPKALGDIFAVYCLLPGLFLAERGLRDRRSSDLLWAGGLLALGGMIRYQNLPLLVLPLLGAFFYGYKLTDLKTLKAYAYAALLVIVAAGVIDLLLWGDLFHSLFYAFDFYLARGGATSSTLTPPLWYFRIFWNMQGILFPMLCGLALLALPRVKLLWTAMLFYFLFHAGFAQKEYRYIFFCLPALMITAAVGFASLLVWLKDPRWRPALGVIAAAAFLALSVQEARTFTWGELDYRSRFVDRRQSAWTVERAHIRAYRYLARRPDLRGLDDRVDTWAWSPGYYYLHQRVPLHFPEQPKTRTNYCLVRGQLGDRRLEKMAQFDDLVVYRQR
jgi:phosphatidylinositol glycan class B